MSKVLLALSAAGAVLPDGIVKSIGVDIYGRSTSNESDEPINGRPCLYCGALHTHNNSFCCAEHCRAYRAEQRGKRFLSGGEG